MRSVIATESLCAGTGIWHPAFDPQACAAQTLETARRNLTGLTCGCYAQSDVAPRSLGSPCYQRGFYLERSKGRRLSDVSRCQFGAIP